MPARGLSFRAVFIPGLVERAFPAPARQDPLLLDHERQEVNEALGEPGRIPLKRSRFQEERLLFSLALGSAREKLILSYPRLDPSSGRERIPSFFLLRVGEALHGEILDYSRLETLPEYRRVPLSRLAPEDPEMAIDEEEFDLSPGRKGSQKRRTRRSYLLEEPLSHLARAERLARLRWGFRVFTEYDGCLKSARARQHLRDRFALSGTESSPPRNWKPTPPVPSTISSPKSWASEPFLLPRRFAAFSPWIGERSFMTSFPNSTGKSWRKTPVPCETENVEVYRQIMDEVAARAVY